MRRSRLLGALGACLAAGCATSTQRIRIECVPERVEVYVDGRLLEQAEAGEVVLRTNEPHKIFVKGSGYEPRLVVLEPREQADGRTGLGPDALCIEMVPVGLRRELELEVEREAGDGSEPGS